MKYKHIYYIFYQPSSSAWNWSMNGFKKDKSPVETFSGKMVPISVSMPSPFSHHSKYCDEANSPYSTSNIQILKEGTASDSGDVEYFLFTQSFLNVTKISLSTQIVTLRLLWFHCQWVPRGKLDMRNG